jgi:hypothetical protein
VNDVNDEKVRRLLDDLAGEVRLDPGIRTPTLRRARRRRAVNATLAGVLSATLVVTAIAVARTTFPTTPAPRPGIAPVVVPAADRLPSIWPEANLREVRASQRRVAGGGDPWRTDPVATASHFATGVLGWDGSLVTVSGSDPGVGTPAAASNLLLEIGTDDEQIGDRIALRLRRFAGPGEGGIWSVTEVRSAGIVLRSPMPGQRFGFGAERTLVVRGQLASPQPVARIQVFDGPPIGRPLKEFVTGSAGPVDGFNARLPSAYSSLDGAVTLVVRSEGEDGTVVAATMFTLTVPRRGDQPEPTEQPGTPATRPIEVESPIAGESVTSPVMISGTADVFEATVSMEVRDELGRVVGRGFATATCSTGCRGDYEARVRFKVDHDQAGTIVVYQANPSDEGPRRLFPVTVPVTLSAPSPPPPTPPIVVDEPIEDARVSSPVTVSGTANVFEGTVSIRILDANGAVLAEDFTTATCGSGCAGTYRTRVRFRVDHEQRGSIQVFESSAENGEPLHLVEIPVTLVPS